MSISTACIIVRSARESSRIDVSLAIAVGVATEVLQQRQLRAFGFDEELRGRLKATRDDDARDIVRQREPQRRGPRRRFEAFEIPDFALAEDQHPSGLEVLVKAGERQPGLLDVRARDDAVRPSDAGQQLEGQAERLRPAAKQHTDAHAWNGDMKVEVERLVREVRVANDLERLTRIRL